MKISIVESHAGELAGLAPADIVDRAATGLCKALQQIIGVEMCGGELHKGSTRGGEMQVIEDLAQGLVDVYADRLVKLRADLTSRVVAAFDE